MLDEYLHGTHVSGIAGAKGNNGFGVTGVNWDVKIMAVSIGLAVYESNALEAYAYVFDQRKLYDETNGEKGAFVVVTNSSLELIINCLKIILSGVLCMIHLADLEF